MCLRASSPFAFLASSARTLLIYVGWCCKALLSTKVCCGPFFQARCGLPPVFLARLRRLLARCKGITAMTPVSSTEFWPKFTNRTELLCFGKLSKSGSVLLSNADRNGQNSEIFYDRSRRSALRQIATSAREARWPRHGYRERPRSCAVFLFLADVSNSRRARAPTRFFSVTLARSPASTYCQYSLTEISLHPFLIVLNSKSVRASSPPEYKGRFQKGTVWPALECVLILCALCNTCCLNSVAIARASVFRWLCPKKYQKEQTTKRLLKERLTRAPAWLIFERTCCSSMVKNSTNRAPSPSYPVCNTVTKQ